MSGKIKPSKPKLDARVRRTRDALGDALVALIEERPFDSITVQHVLDRAGVGRSTFYSHFRGKHDLFLSDMEDFLEGMCTLLLRTREQSDRVAPVRELFAHVAQMHPLHSALIAADKFRDFLELAHGHFARAIDQRLAELPVSQSMLAPVRIAFAQALAGALLSLMCWWLDHQATGSPAQMDDFFHRMVWGTVFPSRASQQR